MCRGGVWALGLMGTRHSKLGVRWVSGCPDVASEGPRAGWGRSVASTTSGRVLQGRRVGRRSLVLPLRGDQAWRPTARHGLAGSGLGHLVQRPSPLGVPAARVSAWGQAPAPIAFQPPAHTLGGRCGVGIPGFGLIQSWLLGASGSEPAAWGLWAWTPQQWPVSWQVPCALGPGPGHHAQGRASGDAGRTSSRRPFWRWHCPDLSSFLWPQPGEGPTQDHPCALPAEW